MKINKFVFLIPNTAWFGYRYWHNFPYTVGLLSAVVKKFGYNVEVIDANLENLSEDSLSKKIEAAKPDVVAISAMTIMYRKPVHRSFEIVKRVNGNIATIIGGIYPTLSADIVSRDPNIDYIVSGEGEQRLPALLKAIEANSGFEKIDGLAYRKAAGDSFV